MQKKSREFLTIQLDASELNYAQKRLLKYLNSMLLNTMTTNSESEYFDTANESMKMLTELIRQANFIQLESTKNKDIPYSTQAIEFCVESVYEDISNKKIHVFDN